MHAARVLHFSAFIFYSVLDSSNPHVLLFSRMFYLVFLYKPCLVFIIFLSHLTKLSYIIVKNITVMIVSARVCVSTL